MAKPASVPLTRAVLFVALLALGAAGAAGQQVSVRAYLPNMAEEDWSFLKDPSRKSDYWGAVKYIALGLEDWFFTLGGEIRYRPEGLRIRGIGERPSLIDNYLLQGHLFGADFHMGRRLRLYGESQSGIINRQCYPNPQQ